MGFVRCHLYPTNILQSPLTTVQFCLRLPPTSPHTSSRELFILQYLSNLRAHSKLFFLEKPYFTFPTYPSCKTYLRSHTHIFIMHWLLKRRKHYFASITCTVCRYHITASDDLLYKGAVSLCMSVWLSGCTPPPIFST